jgi:hypothetical protein
VSGAGCRRRPETGAGLARAPRFPENRDWGRAGTRAGMACKPCESKVVDRPADAKVQRGHGRHRARRGVPSSQPCPRFSRFAAMESQEVPWRGRALALPKGQLSCGAPSDKTSVSPPRHAGDCLDTRRKLSSRGFTVSQWVEWAGGVYDILGVKGPEVRVREVLDFDKLTELGRTFEYGPPKSIRGDLFLRDAHSLYPSTLDMQRTLGRTGTFYLWGREYKVTSMTDDGAEALRLRRDRDPRRDFYAWDMLATHPHFRFSRAADWVDPDEDERHSCCRWTPAEMASVYSVGVDSPLKKKSREEDEGEAGMSKEDDRSEAEPDQEPASETGSRCDSAGASIRGRCMEVRKGDVVRHVSGRLFVVTRPPVKLKTEWYVEVACASFVVSRNANLFQTADDDFEEARAGLVRADALRAATMKMSRLRTKCRTSPNSAPALKDQVDVLKQAVSDLKGFPDI